MNKEYSGKVNLDVMSFATNYNFNIFKWLQTSNYQKILDFGAGNGEYCNRVAEDTIHAIEIDNTLRSRLKCPSFNSIEDVNIKDSYYDLIYSLNVFEHIKDDFFVLSQLSKKLSQDGVIKILVPARMEIYSRMDSNVGHHRRYNKKRLIELMESNDFEILECKYFDFLGYFIALLYKFIDNSGDISLKSIILYDRIIFPLSSFFDKITFGKIIGKNLIVTAKIRAQKMKK